MESKRTSLRAGIIDILGLYNVTKCTGDRDNMTVIGLNHRWKELFYHREMRDGVDLKCLTDPGFWLVENGRSSCNACIVDNDSWLAMISTD